MSGSNTSLEGFMRSSSPSLRVDFTTTLESGVTTAKTAGLSSIVVAVVVSTNNCFWDKESGKMGVLRNRFPLLRGVRSASRCLCSSIWADQDLGVSCCNSLSDSNGLGSSSKTRRTPAADEPDDTADMASSELLLLLLLLLPLRRALSCNPRCFHQSMAV